MAIQDDFAVATSGAITYVGSGSTYYTVLALHRYLQDYADNAATSSDDLVDITSPTPSSRSTDNIIALINGYYLDDSGGTHPASQQLYDGSITQTHPTNGAETYAGLVVVGSVASGTQVQITQDEATLTSFWSTGLNADATQSIISRMLIKTQTNGAYIDGQRLIVWARELGATYAEFSVTTGLGNNVAALFTGTDLNYQDSSGTISGWGTTTNTEGYQNIDINADGTNEHYYSKWNDATTPYGTAGHKRIYEWTKWAARRGSSTTLYGVNGQRFRGITHKVPYNTLTGTYTQNAIVAWGTSFAYSGGTGTVPAVGQYWKNTTRGDVAKVVYVSPGAGATGTVMFQREATATTWANTDAFSLLGGTGTFTINGSVTGQTNTGGSGILLADDGAANMWVQVVSGAAPANGYLLYERTVATATWNATVNGSPTGQSVKAEFVGTYTGSALIGAYGIGITAGQGIAADILTALDGATYQPPNYQTFTVSGLNITNPADRVLVAPYNAGTEIDFGQLQVNTALTTATVTSIVVKTGTETAVPADTPNTPAGNGISGWLRVKTNAGVFHLCPYASWTGTTFTLALPASAAVEIDVVATAGTFTRASGSFLSDGFAPGMRVTFANFTNGGNNVSKTILSVTPTVITVTDTTGLVNETGSGDETVTAIGQDFSGDNASVSNLVFIGYIDKTALATSESTSLKYTADRTFWVRVRNGGTSPIKTFESQASFSSTGGSATAIRTLDT